MADGIACKQCGWYEADHYGGTGLSEDEGSVSKKDYAFTLNECPSYEPEDAELAQRLQALADEEKAGRRTINLDFGGEAE